MNWACQKLIFFTIFIIIYASNDYSQGDGYLRSQKLEQKEEVNIFENQDTISDMPDLQPIRITYTLTNFNSSDISDEDRTDITSIIDGLVNFFNKFIKVVPSPGPNQLNRILCLQNEVPNTHKDTGVFNSDLQIYIKHQEILTHLDQIKEDTQAQAQFCKKLEMNRSTFGGVNIKTENVTNLRKDNKFQQTARILFHEFLHILSFNSNINTQEKQNQSTSQIDEEGNQKWFLKSKLMLHTAKKYFECETYNQISVNNFEHWTHSDLQDEIMFPEMDQMRLSILTAMYIKDFNSYMDANENLVESYSGSKVIAYKNSLLENVVSKQKYPFICLNNCSYHGICINNQCMCNPGYSGEDCFLKCEYSFEGECLSQCPEGKFANPDNTCKPGCPRGYYKNGNHTCSLCDFSCSDCDGPLKNNCKACQYLTHLNKKFNTCVLCEYDEYFNSEEQKCMKCSTNCLSCESATKCTHCKVGFQISGNTCIQKEISNCLEYNPENLEQCVKCEPMFTVDTNNHCEECDPGCASCTIEECIQCDEIQNFRFVYFKGAKVCHKDIHECNQHCKLCKFKYPDVYYCDACETGFVLQNDNCKQSCDIGFYEDQNVCKECDPSCLECSHSATACTKFKQNEKLSNGKSEE